MVWHFIQGLFQCSWDRFWIQCDPDEKIAVFDLSFIVGVYPSIFSVQVKLVEQGMGYLVIGGLVTATLALLPFCFRLTQQLDMTRLSSITLNEVAVMAAGKPSAHSIAFFFITSVERVFLSGLFFFMMCVAERTYKQVQGSAFLFSQTADMWKYSKMVCTWNKCVRKTEWARNLAAINCWSRFTAGQ